MIVRSQEGMKVESDGDGHYWLVPVGLEDEFESYLEKCAYEDVDLPEEVIELDNPHKVLIHECRIED